MPKKIPFTYEDLRAWSKERLTRREVAERMGCKYSTAQSRIERLDPKRKLAWRPEPHHSPGPTYDDFLKLADQQYTRSEAFKEIGITQHYGYRRLQRVDPKSTIPWRTLPRSKAQLRALARIYKSRTEAARALNYHPEYFRNACRQIDPEREVPWESEKNNPMRQSAPATPSSQAPTDASTASTPLLRAGSSDKVGATDAPN